jgi:hypothetical protein
MRIRILLFTCGPGSGSYRILLFTLMLIRILHFTLMRIQLCKLMQILIRTLLAGGCGEERRATQRILNFVAQTGNAALAQWATTALPTAS